MKRQFMRLIYLLFSFMLVLTSLLVVQRPASAATTVPLSGINPGDTVSFGGQTWIVLSPGDGYLLMQGFWGTDKYYDGFGNTFDPNDIKSIANYLNNDFYNSLNTEDRAFIQLHTWNTGNYNDETARTATCNIGLISESEWYKYKSIIGYPPSPFWTITPCDNKYAAVEVLSNGSPFPTTASSTIMVRPALYLSPDILVSDGVVTTQLNTASSLTVTTAGSTPTAGTAFDVTVTARDASGYTIQGYMGTVHFSSSDASAVLPADYTFTADDKGTHTFTGGVTLKTSGTQTVTVTDTVTNSITGASGNLTVAPAAVSSLTVTTSTTTPTAGAAFNATVTAEDAYGNTVTGYSGAVHFTSSDASAALPPDYIFAAADSGTHTFSVNLKTAGTQSITATDTGSGSITGTTGSIEVSPGTVDSGQSTVAADVYSVEANGTDASTITVTVRDAYGNPVGNTAVTLIKDGGSSVITAIYGTSQSDGTAVFAVTDTKAETVTYTAEAAGVTVSQTAMVSFIPGPSARLSWQTQPGGGTSGQVWSQQPVVALEDMNGNVEVSNSTDTVEVALTAANGATLTGTKTVTFSSGIATFSGLSVDRAGTYTLTATSGTITSSPSSSFTIIAGSAGSTILSVSPYSVPADGYSAGTVTAVVYDTNDNPVPNVELNFSTDLGQLGSSAVTTDGNGRAANTITSTTAGTASVQVSGGGQSFPVQVVFTPTIAVADLDPNFGPVAGGTLVTINGSGLEQVNDVYFGSVAGTVYGTPTSVSLSVYAPTGPPGGGSVHVVLLGPGGPSAETSADLFTYLTPVPAPTITPDRGVFTGSVSISIDNIASGCEAYYNLSSMVPGQSSLLYSGPFAIDRNSTVTAAVYDPVHGLWSPAVTADFTIQVATPTASPASGSTVGNNTAIILEDATPGAAIHYTMDGSLPTGSSPSGTSVTVSGNPGVSVLVKAYAVKTGMMDSAIATFSYIISSSGSTGGSHGPVTPQPASSTTGSATVNPVAGGIVSLGGDVSLNIPADALQGSFNAQVDMQKTDSHPPAPSGFMILGAAYQLTVNGQDHYSFNKPVTLTFTFDPSSLAPGETPAVYYYDEDKGQWVNIGGTVSGNTITVTVDHFTIYAVMTAEKAAESPEQKPSAPLTDISGHWAEANIEELVSLGTMSGYPDGTFRPDSTITRAEFATVLVKAFKLAPKQGRVFDDTANSWARDYISTAAAYGILNGYDENTFGPDDPVTREQMAVMAMKAAKLSPAREQLTFTDSADISAWAREAVATVVQDGIMKGYPDNTFRPQSNATRAEAVTIILNALK